MTPEERQHSCCFTGHRLLPPPPDIYGLKRFLVDYLEGAIEMGYTDFYAGGANGFDRLAANAVLYLKKSHPHIRLHLLIPCKDQDKMWSFEEKRDYKKQIKAADSVTYLTNRYYDGCMKERNQMLVNCASLCIAFVRGQATGAGQTLRMAKAAGLACINLGDRPLPRNPEDQTDLF